MSTEAFARLKIDVLLAGSNPRALPRTGAFRFGVLVFALAETCCGDCGPAATRGAQACVVGFTGVL